MSGAIAAAAITTIGSALVGRALAPKQKNPSMPELPKPPQPSKVPDQSLGRDLGARLGRDTTRGSTLLTGASGVDPGSLNLGKSTLLGQ